MPARGARPAPGHPASSRARFTRLRCRNRARGAQKLRRGTAARGAIPAGVDARYILAGGVAPRSNTDGILSRRALPAGPIARLGATRESHDGPLRGRSGNLRVVLLERPN